MAELTIRPEEIRDALERFVEAYEPGTASTEEVGAVVECGDGIARVSGLPSVMANELLEFEDGTRGIALNLDVREIGVVVLGEFSQIEEGQRVRRTSEVLSVPVGDGFLGRVVGPLGAPLDGLGPIQGPTHERQLELQAPSVVQRQPVSEPLQTGIKAIDATTPIGRGQRELIIGDRQTGKTTIAIDTILNQKQNWDTGDPTKQVRCIYVAIGQKGSTVASVRQALDEAGALEYTTIVLSPASDPAGFKYIAPYTGSAIGQNWMYQGKHVLIVFDDLTKQAEAYRAISLLLRRAAGPRGLSRRRVLPALPAARALREAVRRARRRFADRPSDRGDEGQRHLGVYPRPTSSQLLMARSSSRPTCSTPVSRPAMNVGQSVSRVGGNAQIKAMKKVAGGLKLALSQYRDLEAFASFSSDLDPASRAQLDRGARLVELLKQPQYSPFPVERQVVSIWIANEGYLDDVPVEDVRRFENEFLDYLQTSHSGIYGAIRETGDLSEDTVVALQGRDRQVPQHVREVRRRTAGPGGVGCAAQQERGRAGVDPAVRPVGRQPVREPVGR